LLVDYSSSSIEDFYCTHRLVSCYNDKVVFSAKDNQTIIIEDKDFIEIIKGAE
jgi:hypothetical protein